MPLPWEAVCLVPDLADGVVLQGHWNGIELAIWRSATGQPGAFRDRCPHRGMRLSHGFVRGETLSCIYHGWVYGKSGGCNHIPAHPQLVPPASIKAEALTCVDHGGVVFVSDGADPANLPDLAGFKPVRSMALSVSAERVAGLLAGASVVADGVLHLTIALSGRQATLCLLFQAIGGGTTMLHVLADTDSDPVAVSRWLETMRRSAENGVAA